MKTIKTAYLNGQVLEILKLSDSRYLVRKRKNNKILGGKECSTEAEALRYFQFCRL